jgi:hypothetical protein
VSGPHKVEWHYSAHGAQPYLDDVQHWRRVVILLVIALLAVETVVMRRRGYAIGRNTIVRCRDGHLFSTIWIPGASLKALRLEPVRWMRFQYCPVGRHWAPVVPVKDSDLTDEDRRIALEHHDLAIP